MSKKSEYMFFQDTEPPSPECITLFVFYTEPKDYWEYKKMPSGWKWIGSGRTHAVNAEKKSFYTNEEQFSGSSSNKKQMESFLNKTFSLLQEQKIISAFIIKENYDFNL
jgi:hypothetical protein